MMYRTLHLDSDTHNDIEPLVTGIIQNTSNPISHVCTVYNLYVTAHMKEYKKFIKGGRALLAAFLVKRLCGKVGTKTDQFYPMNGDEPAELKDKTR